MLLEKSNSLLMNEIEIARNLGYSFDSPLEATIDVHSLDLIEHLTTMSKLIQDSMLLSTSVSMNRKYLHDGDISHQIELHKKLKGLEELTALIQEIISDEGKDKIMEQVLQPFAGDYLSLEKRYQQPLHESIIQMVSTFRNLSDILSSISSFTSSSSSSSSSSMDLKSPQLGSSLAQLSSVIAKCQRYSQALAQQKRSMDKLTVS